MLLILDFLFFHLQSWNISLLLWTALFVLRSDISLNNINSVVHPWNLVTVQTVTQSCFNHFCFRFLSGDHYRLKTPKALQLHFGFHKNTPPSLLRNDHSERKWWSQTTNTFMCVSLPTSCHWWLLHYHHGTSKIRRLKYWWSRSSSTEEPHFANIELTVFTHSTSSSTADQNTTYTVIIPVQHFR